MRRILFVLILLISPSLYAASEQYPDIAILQNTETALVFEWQPAGLQNNPLQAFRAISFSGAVQRQTTGQPNIPWRAIKIGIPEGSNITVHVQELESDLLTGHQLAPVPQLSRDQFGLDNSEYVPDNAIYTSDAIFPENNFEISEPTYFRDIQQQQIFITPVRYNPVSGTIHISRKLRVQVQYNQAETISRRYTPRGKLDRLYEQLFLNYDQAKFWQKEVIAGLRKTTAMPSGKCYGITVTQDGLYKIAPAVLQAAGIDISNLNISSIQMFNNGGHMLSYSVKSTLYNPATTTEIPIFVQDADQNGLFNGNDFILFYGKHVNGWFYDASAKDYTFHQHLYANENKYWLTVAGSNGLRMEKQLLTGQSGATEAGYFMERYHFEEEQYNLLASGPDWYGYRFYGKSGSYSKDFNISPLTSAEAQATVKVALKGGSGVHYGDDQDYRYIFNIYLNNQAIFTNSSFTRHTLATYSKTISNLSVLNAGMNNLSFQYSGNVDGCNAHLDWFEIYYPRAFTAASNQLNFYTKDLNTIKRYRVSGFSELQDIFAFDISNASDPKILLENSPTQNGEIIFDMPSLTAPKNILISSLSASNIQNVSTVTPGDFGQDLLSTSNQADFLILTHPTFVTYANQLSALRTHLTSKVITTEEVYMNFNSGVQDPTAIRNFIRYAYYNWQKDAPSYVLLFGDASYDYRNLNLADTMRVPTMEIYDDFEIDSRCTDNYFVDLDYKGNSTFSSISEDLAIGRLPVESSIDAVRILEKIIRYESDPAQDGWQLNLIMVADDQYRPKVTTEWLHQNASEKIATLSNLSKFNIRKVYLSMYPSSPGGFDRVKPLANNALIDYLNQGALAVNYVGHGSPTQWAHEAVFTMSRDLNRISNEGRLPFLIAATCDFGKFDDPMEPSFAEALIWMKSSGIIGALASCRLAFSTDNERLDTMFFVNLFPSGKQSIPLGDAKMLATNAGENDQKYILFADPTMRLADPKQKIAITSISPDTLKALSQVEVKGQVLVDNQPVNDYNGKAMLLVNDASYDSVKTGDDFILITLPGSQLFKGEISVANGEMTGKFIVPKSIRYVDKKRGRMAILSWNDANTISALGYTNTLLVNGSADNTNDGDGPGIDLYFKDQEDFSSGDIVPQNPVLIASLNDAHGINITGQTGHNISMVVDDETPRDISGFFVYDKDSFIKGSINYPLDELTEGQHTLHLTAFDNLNNPREVEISFRVMSSSDLALLDVVNYPNPFQNSTQFTFQTNRDGAEVRIKIYTISGRLIQELWGLSASGFNRDITWDGRDRDGDEVANGVYLYKIRLDDGVHKKEVIEKLVILR